MTILPIHSLTPGHQNPDAATPGAAAAAATPSAEQKQVAQQFEAIFLRKLLGSMEKSGGLGGTGNGAEVYRSMMVGAMADSAATGGGIGLADVILKAMLPPAAPKAEPGVPAGSPVGQGSPAGPSVLHRATPEAEAQPAPRGPLPASLPTTQND